MGLTRSTFYDAPPATLPDHGALMAERCPDPAIFIAFELIADRADPSEKSIHSAFDNWAEHDALYGDAPILEMSYPRAQSHRQVPMEIHQRLMGRVALTPRAGQAA